MSILVFGSTGQVASELINLSDKKKLGYQFIGRKDADLENPEKCSDLILSIKPEAVINAAAWTAVDEAETSEHEVLVINGKAPGLMAKACKKMDIPFLHISSDYVFDGKGNSPWRHDDAVNPLSVYGKSKALGEKLVMEAKTNSIILRTSWVFSKYGSNFVKTILKLSKEREFLNVVSDQYGGPTSAKSIAETVSKLTDFLLNDGLGGIYHFSGAPDISWADFAKEIMIQAGINCKILPILSSEFKTRAPRPLNSRLNGDRLFETCQIPRSDWKKELNLVLRELKEI